MDKDIVACRSQPILSGQHVIKLFIKSRRSGSHIQMTRPRRDPLKEISTRLPTCLVSVSSSRWLRTSSFRPFCLHSPP